MKFSTYSIPLVVMGMVMLLSGCAGLKDAAKKDVDANLKAQPEQPLVSSENKDAVATSSVTSSKPDMVAMQGESGNSAAYGPLDGATGLLSKRVIYFDYDSANVSSDSKAIIGAHAQYLQNNKTAQVLLEGHTDARGSREYNMALGERRALTVQQIMLLTGVSREQIELVSYGEEQPAEQGDNEDAWSKNRRVELVYRKN